MQREKIRNMARTKGKGRLLAESGPHSAFSRPDQPTRSRIARGEACWSGLPSPDHFLEQFRAPRDPHFLVGLGRIKLGGDFVTGADRVVTAESDTAASSGLTTVSNSRFQSSQQRRAVRSSFRPGRG